MSEAMLGTGLIFIFLAISVIFYYILEAFGDRL